MTTTRTIAASRSGPVTLHATLSAFELHVITEARSYGEITVTGDKETVDAFTLDASGSDLTVRSPQGGGGSTIIQTGGRGGSSFISVGRGQNVIVGNGVTMVNGVVVSGSGSYVQVGGEPVVIVARLPHGSDVNASTQSGRLQLDGVYDQVDASSQSGSIDLDTARVAQVRTQSGSVYVRALTGSGALESMSGSIEVAGPAQASCSARTMSGNVRYSGGIRVAGSSMSGRVLGR